MIRPTIRTALAVAVAALCAVAPPASAQNYPTRPIKFVVPFAAGSATDTLARVLGEHVSKTLRGNIVVENMAGGSGVIAAQAVARAAPDGYTVLIATNTTHAANQSLLKQMPYDAVNDFEPISKIGTIVLALIAHPSVPAKSVRELVTYAKANPGKLSFGAGSSSSRLAGEMLKSLAGIDIVHVAYRSNPQAITDILGGHIQLIFADLSTTLPQIKDGKVTGLGVSSAQRTPLAPDLPTMVEAGVAGYELKAWLAAFAPAKTPRPVVDQLRTALHGALADKATTDRMLAAGIEAEKSSSEELKAFVVSETKKWADIVKAAGIQPE
jgi:tripartite-type tricarboxylate transporter receptor subunit TctC